MFFHVDPQGLPFMVDVWVDFQCWSRDVQMPDQGYAFDSRSPQVLTIWIDSKPIVRDSSVVFTENSD